MLSRDITLCYNTNPLINGDGYHSLYENARTVKWTEDRLHVTRLRLVSDQGNYPWEVSYCHGRIGVGEFAERVIVDLPFRKLKKTNRKFTVKLQQSIGQL